MCCLLYLAQCLTAERDDLGHLGPHSKGHSGVHEEKTEPSMYTLDNFFIQRCEFTLTGCVHVQL